MKWNSHAFVRSSLPPRRLSADPSSSCWNYIPSFQILLALGRRRGSRRGGPWSLHRLANDLGPLVRDRRVPVYTFAVPIKVPGVPGGCEVAALRGFDPPFSGLGIVLLHAFAVGIHHRDGGLRRHVTLPGSFQCVLEVTGGQDRRTLLSGDLIQPFLP